MKFIIKLEAICSHFTDLSSYKLVQYLKQSYVNPEGIPTPIVIRSRTARRWLHSLGFEYKEVKKDVFVDGHERSDVVEDRKHFLKKMKDLEPYLVEFEADGAMKPKTYPLDCIVGGHEQRLVIVITHDECTFSANDGKRTVWMKKGESKLRPKGRGQGIMASEFLLPFGRLNLLSMSQEKREQVRVEKGLSVTEAVELFEYGKNYEGYWDGAKLYEQVVSKALPIAEALYPGYAFLFLFDNATSHSVYASDALRTNDMNKNIGGQQAHLRTGWYEMNGIRYEQQMSFQDSDGKWVQKEIQKVLEERNLWPQEGLNLECPRPKCFNCQVAFECKMCIKGIRCDSCKSPKQHSSTPCSKARKCDACVRRSQACKCTYKQYCARCSGRKGKCADCEELPPKCGSNSKFYFDKNYF